jgi:hypothetical protein
MISEDAIARDFTRERSVHHSYTSGRVASLMGERIWLRQPWL